jgi:hypothetical protein
MRSRAAKSLSTWIGCRQTCVAPAVKCARRPLLIVSASPHRTIAFDEPVATAVGEFSLGEALAQPAVAVVRQHHLTRQLLAPERPCLRGIGLERNLLLHREPLRRPEDRGRLSRMLRLMQRNKFVLFASSLPRLNIGCAITGLIATAVSNHAGRPADVWSNADSWVAKPSQAVQYRRD